MTAFFFPLGRITFADLVPYFSVAGRLVDSLPDYGEGRFAPVCKLADTQSRV